MVVLKAVLLVVVLVGLLGETMAASWAGQKDGGTAERTAGSTELMLGWDT